MNEGQISFPPPPPHTMPEPPKPPAPKPEPVVVEPPSNFSVTMKNNALLTSGVSCFDGCYWL